MADELSFEPDEGFTLLELLVTISIIGILAAMAISMYSAYRTRAFDARALSDLRNVMSAQEAYFADNETYVNDMDALTGFDTESPAVTVILAGDDDGWAGSSYHPMGSHTYCYDSEGDVGIRTVSGVNQPCPAE